MKRTINGLEFHTCTAIAVGIDDSRQNALFCHDVTDEFHDGDAVVFGYELPASAEDVQTMIEDWSAWCTDFDTLSTVIFD